MNTKAETCGHELSLDDLMDVRGGQEEVAVVPFLVGWAAGKVLDYGYEKLSQWDASLGGNTPPTGPYDAANEAAARENLQTEMVEMMDEMSDAGSDDAGYDGAGYDGAGYGGYGG
jgi:hypothetical protein